MNISKYILILLMFFIFPIAQSGAQNAGNEKPENTIGEGYKAIKDAQEKREGAEKQPSSEQVVDMPSESSSPGKQEAQPNKDPRKLAEAEKTPPYDSSGKRDPFKPFIKLVATPVGPTPEIRPPILRYPLNNFRLSGIIIIGDEPRAMVVDPEENTYFLGVGDKIGNKNGEILEVRENGLLVQEKSKLENVYGEIKIVEKKSVLAFKKED